MRTCRNISITVILVLLGTIGLQAQERMIPLSLSYYMDLELESPVRVDPGLLIDLTFPIASNAGKSSNHYREFHFKPTFGFYKRENYHTGMIIWTQLGFKGIRRSGAFWEINAGPGYLHTFYNAPVFAQNPDGSFSEQKVEGDFHAMVGGDLSIGWDFARSTEIPISVFVGGGFYGRFPHNSNWARHKFMKIGFSYVFRR